MPKPSNFGKYNDLNDLLTPEQKARTLQSLAFYPQSTNNMIALM